LISPVDRSIIGAKAMVIEPAQAWRLALSIALVAAIFISLYARAPRRAPAGGDLRRLVLAALGLYAVGGLASLAHHPRLAAVVYAAGIVVCALAAWLSRGTDSEDPPGGDEPVDEQPPPEPDGLPAFNWEAFEREFRRYSEREPAGLR
jgi:hypothetical protein